MKLSDFAYLADENVHGMVVSALRKTLSIHSVAEAGLAGSSDAEVLGYAYSSHLVVLTHDPDFGTLVIAQGQPVFGILLVRPGSIDHRQTTKNIVAAMAIESDIWAPFVAVIDQRQTGIRLRVRAL